MENWNAREIFLTSPNTFVSQELCVDEMDFYWKQAQINFEKLYVTV